MLPRFPSLSEAHQKSRFAVIDPVYDALQLIPAPDLKPDAAPWLYGEAELECWRLQVLRQRVVEVKLNVAYPGVFHTPSARATFRLILDPSETLPNEVVLRAVGDVVITLGNREIYRASAADSPHSAVLPKDLPAGEKILEVSLITSAEPPALLIEAGPLATGTAPWLWSADGTEFTESQPFFQTLSGTPSHCRELAEVILTPVGREAELFDMGCEVLGLITFACAGQPALWMGESMAEARNNNAQHCEQSPALKSIGDGTWISEHPLAFRYFRITGGEPSDVKCRALFSPARYRGAFACSDERLTRIWMTSAYTLRLCLHDFLIDGVKRDRLPWVGDLAMSLMANAFVFGDGEIVRRSLVALGRAGIGQEHLNGIVDYSMWWIIAQEYYQLYYGDGDYLHRAWPQIKEIYDGLAVRSDAEGLFIATPEEWVFVDWVSQDKQTALQIIWWWAQTSAAKLAERIGDAATAKAWRERADALEETLSRRAWDAQIGSWRGRPDEISQPSRHANIFAVISGLAKPEHYPSIRTALLGKTVKAVGTPYVSGFENMALARMGDSAALQQRVDACWGGMLDRGATTFWEAWDANEKGDEAYGFYGRPFAKSLCHAWSAGPAAFLPSEICGLRPLADGWIRFEVDPQLGPLEWACATVPTPQGDIEIFVDRLQASLQVPAGATAIWRGRSFPGPGRFTLNQL